MTVETILQVETARTGGPGPDNYTVTSSPQLATVLSCVTLSMGQAASSSAPASEQEDDLRHPHWRSQHPLQRWQHQVIGAYMLMLGVTAVLGNIIVIWAFARYRSLRTSSNLLVVNLAVGDLLMCTVDFPLFIVSSFLQHWPFGKIVCQLYGALTATAGLVTINSLAIISLDRYHAVSNHLHPAQPRPSRTIGAAAAGVWAYSLLWALAPVAGWGGYVLDGVGTTCTFDFLTRTTSNLSFVISITVGNFVLPLVLIIFSYSGIWQAVRSTHVSLRRQGDVAVSMGTQRQRLGLQADLRTALILLVIVTTFLLSWTPYLVICCIGLFGPGSHVTMLASVLPSIVAKTSTALNPVLYSISHPKVRRKIRCMMIRVMPRLVRRLTRSSGSTNTITNNNNSGGSRNL